MSERGPTKFEEWWDDTGGITNRTTLTLKDVAWEAWLAAKVDSAASIVEICSDIVTRTNDNSIRPTADDDVQ